MTALKNTKRLTICMVMALVFGGAATPPRPATAGVQKSPIGIKWTHVQTWRAPNGRTVSTSMIFYSINKNPSVLARDNAAWARHFQDMRNRGYWALNSWNTNYLYIY